MKIFSPKFQESNEPENLLPNEVLFTVEAAQATKIFFYLILSAFIIWFGISFFQEYQSSSGNFFALLFYRLSDWRIGLLIVILTIFFLNLHARSVLFFESYFVYRRWYWKNNYYNYPDITKIIYDYKSETNGIIIELKDGKKIKIPPAILRDSNENNIARRLGTDLVEFLQEMTGNSVRVE